MTTAQRALPRLSPALMPRQPRAAANDSTRPGRRASKAVTFGELSRFAVYAVHTRFGAVSWFVTDAETTDPVTDSPAVIRQAATFAEAVADWAE